jgi:hypothetical protein
MWMIKWRDQFTLPGKKVLKGHYFKLLSEFIFPGELYLRNLGNIHRR